MKGTTTTLAITAAIGIASAAAAGTAANGARRAANPAVAKVSGKVLSMRGCLDQETTGERYYELENAQAADGAKLGNLRITGNFIGLDPEDNLHKEIQVKGLVLTPTKMELGSEDGRLEVEGAKAIAGKCS